MEKIKMSEKDKQMLKFLHGSMISGIDFNLDWDANAACKMAQMEGRKEVLSSLRRLEKKSLAVNVNGLCWRITEAGQKWYAENMERNGPEMEVSANALALLEDLQDRIGGVIDKDCLPTSKLLKSWKSSIDQFLRGSQVQELRKAQPWM